MSTAHIVQGQPSLRPNNDDPTTPARKAPEPVKDTAIAVKTSGTALFCTDQPEREARFAGFAIEMIGKFVGPMDPKTFLDTFLGKQAFDGMSVPEMRWTDTLKEKFRKVHDSRVEDGKRIANRETAMYRPLEEAIKDCIDTNSFEYVATHEYTDSNASNSTATAPDAILYSRECSNLRTSKSDSAFSDLVVEVKGPDHSKPFDDKHNSFERDTVNADEVQGQLTIYAVAQFANQFRTHLFMVYIHVDTARFIRWDHAGAVVSAEFAYSEENYLADFFSRYTRATPEARGIDTTVKMLEKHGTLAGEIRVKLELDESAPVFEFKVWSDSKDNEVQFVPYYGTRAFAGNSLSVTGRATRVFKVWDPRENMVVLLKDAWRVACIQREGVIYALLKAKDVKNVPTCLIAGDVNPGAANHHTRTHDYSSKPSRWRKYIHYRLVLQEVCRGNLSTFKDVKELLSVMHDALIAHNDAFTKADLLHRDISVGNILITEDGKGLLADWELAKSPSELANARRPQRAGTWQFISAALLSELVPHATLADDLESYFHVLGWIALQYTNHSKGPDVVEWHLRRGYDDTDGQTISDSFKCMFMGSAALDRDFGFAPGPLADLIKDLEETCASRYAPTPDNKRLEYVLESLARDDLSEEKREIYTSNLDYQTYERRKRLTSSEWFIARFKAAVVSDEWSEHSLERHEIGPPAKKYRITSTERSIEVYESEDALAKRLRTQKTVRGTSQQDSLDDAPEHGD